MSDITGRPILPQGAASFSHDRPWVNMESSGPKNYVFVDEHNRQRRLKVMRACEACRRRKIKCDAVTSNKWPCQRCQKSQLDCVPPPSDGSGFDYDFDQARDTVNSSPPHNGTLSDPHYAVPQSAIESANFNGFQEGFYYHQPPPLNRAQSFDVQAMSQYQVPRQGHIDHFTSPPPPPHRDSSSSINRARQMSTDDPADLWRGNNRQETPSDVDLAEAMGDLQISTVAVAPYMANQKALAQTPAVEEDEIPLPTAKSAGSHTVTIPDEMMPTDEKALQYFELYFRNIHPYVPVIYKPNFYKSWKASKSFISPLILEGIFACGANLMGEKEECARWLALASRHVEAFKDTPRLSTIQGLLIILKAREAIPQRGYYYRSWMTVVMMVAMAKDLEFDQHFETHQDGDSCGSSGPECALKTRIWHLLYTLELMIGGPQGRSDFAVPTATIDFDAPRSIQGLEEMELKIFRDQTQLVRSVRTVRDSNRVYFALRKKKQDWAVDPEFTSIEKDRSRWLEELPPHLQITYPADGSPPTIPFHDVANIHSYHWLAVVMHHRPKLQYASTIGDQRLTLEELRINHEASTKLCRLHEAILQRFGLTGLASMQRGVSLTIYTVLTCTMLHLTAITSPQPDISQEAQGYFVRHMRVLEQCAGAWPMPEIKAQIDSLRLAFSADVSKPFELKPQFPYGSPRKSPTPSTPSDGGSMPYDPSQYSSGQRTDISSTTTATSVSIGSASYDPPRNGSVGSENMYGSGTLDASRGMNHYSHQEAPQFTWNPSRLMSSWDAAFNPPPPTASSNGSATTQPIATPQATANYPNMPQQSPQGFASSETADFDFATYTGTSSYGTNASTFGTSYDSQTSQISQAYMPQTTQPQQVYPVPPVTQQPNFLTPNMWQEAVASTFGDGLKRRYDDGSHGRSKKSAR